MNIANKPTRAQREALRILEEANNTARLIDEMSGFQLVRSYANGLVLNVQYGGIVTRDPGEREIIPHHAPEMVRKWQAVRDIGFSITLNRAFGQTSGRFSKNQAQSLMARFLSCWKGGIKVEVQHYFQDFGMRLRRSKLLPG